MARVAVPPKMQKHLLELNAHSCCVCKRTGIGLNFHHIDGDSSNTIEENLAVLCVNEHDAHHRPGKYPSLNHLDLSADNLKKFKEEWEDFVQECKKDEPRVLATINAFGTYEDIVGMKIIFQKLDGQIVFERAYQRLDGDLGYWTDKALEEVARFGKNIKVAIIDEPLEIEFCNNHCGSLSQTLDEPAARKIIANDWYEKSIATVYTNPTQASLALSIFYNQELVYSVSMHRCKGKIRLSDYKGTKSAKIKLFYVRRQVKAYVEQFLQEWEVGMVFYGTGDPDNPTITDKCVLPFCWEFKDL